MTAKKMIQYTPGYNINDVKKKYNIRNIIKLSSNENPFVSQKVVKYITSKKHNLNLYPESKPDDLQSVIAKILGHKLNKDNILLGNGSNEILELIARSTLDSSSEVIIPKHSFLVYEIISKVQDAKVVISEPEMNKKSFNYLGTNLESIKNNISSKTRLIFLANPANPTGTYISLNLIDKFIKSIPKRIRVVVDEAYYEYLDSKINKTAVSLLSKYDNLYVTRSFSKIYGLASLRIGYGISSQKNINKLRLYKQPFNTNLFAQKAAEIAIKDQAFVNKSKKNNDVVLKSLINLFNDLSIKYLGTYCNFVTFEAGSKANKLFDFLLKKGIVVRPLKNYKLAKYLRVSIGTSNEMKQFIKSLKQFYNGKA